MRCRKVRYFLSAYCSDELDGRRKLAISEHLSHCSACRKEEVIYRTLCDTKPEVPGMKVSTDFNNKLMDRIARERFSETRTKAYMPKKAPVFSWGKAVPAFVSVCMVVLIAVSFMSGGLQNMNNGMTATNNSNTVDDSYLTVQPTNNPNMTVSMNDNWSLNEQLAKAERVNNISNNMTPTGSFGFSRTGVTQVSSHVGQVMPYVPSYYKVRPVVRIYVAPNSDSGKEEKKAY